MAKLLTFTVRVQVDNATDRGPVPLSIVPLRVLRFRLSALEHNTDFVYYGDASCWPQVDAENGARLLPWDRSEWYADPGGFDLAEVYVAARTDGEGVQCEAVVAE